ncbi:hypothetical protein N7540_007070 [Penicillium herquei]|nr:hypothetical protein N7540_007070 [Penicillium herquei]
MADELPSPGREALAESFPIVDPMAITGSELAMLDPVTMSELDFLLGHSSELATPVSNEAVSVPESPVARQSSPISVSSPILPSSPPVLSSSSPIVLSSSPVSPSSAPLMLSSSPVVLSTSPIGLSSYPIVLSSPSVIPSSRSMGSAYQALLEAQIAAVLAPRPLSPVLEAIFDDPFQSPIQGPRTFQDGEPYVLSQPQAPIYFQQEEISSSARGSPNMIHNQAHAPVQQHEHANGIYGLDDMFQSPNEDLGTILDDLCSLLPHPPTSSPFPEPHIPSTPDCAPNVAPVQSYPPAQQQTILEATNGFEDMFQSPIEGLGNIQSDDFWLLSQTSTPCPTLKPQISSTPGYAPDMEYAQPNASVQQQAALDTTNDIEDLFQSSTEDLGTRQDDHSSLSHPPTPSPTLKPQFSSTPGCAPDMVHAQPNAAVQQQAVLDAMNGFDDPFQSRIEDLGTRKNHHSSLLRSPIPHPFQLPQNPGLPHSSPNNSGAQLHIHPPHWQKGILAAPCKSMQDPFQNMSGFPEPAETARLIQSEPRAHAHTKIPVSPKTGRFAAEAFQRLGSALCMAGRNAVQEFDGRPVKVVRRPPAPATSSGQGSRAALRARLLEYAKQIIAEIVPDGPDLSTGGSPEKLAAPSAPARSSKKRKSDEAELEFRFYSPSPPGTPTPSSKRSRQNSTAPPPKKAGMSPSDVDSSHQSRQNIPEAKTTTRRKKAPCKAVPYPRSWAEASGSDILLFELKKAGSTWETIAKTHRDVTRTGYTRSTLQNRYFGIKKSIGDLPPNLVPGGGQA